MLNFTENQQYECPICETSLNDNPTFPTYEICSGCGVEFGNDDYVFSHEELKEAWQEAGNPVWENEGSPEWLDDLLNGRSSAQKRFSTAFPDE